MMKMTVNGRKLAAFLCALSCAIAASATNWYGSPDALPTAICQLLTNR